MNEEVQSPKENNISWEELQPVRRREFTEQISKLYKKIEELERRLDKEEEYQQEQNV